MFNPTAKQIKLKIGDSAKKHPMLFVLDLLLQRKILFAWVVIGIMIHQTLRFVSAPLIGDLVEFGIGAGDYIGNWIKINTVIIN